MLRTSMETVLAQFAAYRVGDRRAARMLLSDDMTFSSPQDDQLDKCTYLATCFPTAERFLRQEITHAVEIEPGTVMLRYTAQLRGEAPFSNVEIMTVVDGQITEIQVYFGGVERGSQRSSSTSVSGTTSRSASGSSSSTTKDT